jgi:hypothetical protein
MQVAHVETVDDAAITFVELRAFVSDRPLAGQWPLIELRFTGGVDVAFGSALSAREPARSFEAGPSDRRDLDC